MPTTYKNGTITAMKNEQDIHASEKTNAFGPMNELNTQDEWSSWIHHHIPDFKGNVKIAGFLMSSFMVGRNYVLNKLTSRGLRGFDQPKVVILIEDSVSYSPIGSAVGGKVEFVRQSYLEEYSQLDMEGIFVVTRADGETAYEGTISDMFKLAGVEETHHGIFEQVKISIPNGIDPLSMTIAEYDAREVEYQALRWQIKYANEFNLSKCTKDKLNERMQAARKLRSGLRKHIS